MSFLETGAALRPQDLLVKGAPAVAAVSAPAAAKPASTFTPPQGAISMGDHVE